MNVPSAERKNKRVSETNRRVSADRKTQCVRSERQRTGLVG